MILTIHHVQYLSPLHKPLAQYVLDNFRDFKIHIFMYDYDRSVDFIVRDIGGAFICRLKFEWNRELQ